MSRFRAAFRCLQFGSSAVARADLYVTKTVNAASQYIDRNVTFTVTVENLGNATATSITITDLLPSGYTYVSSTPAVGSYSSGTGVWTLGTLAAGASTSLQLVAKVAYSGTYLNSATVTTVTPADSNLGNDTSTATVTPLNPLALATPMSYAWMGIPFVRGSVDKTLDMKPMSYGFLGIPYVPWSNLP